MLNYENIKANIITGSCNLANANSNGFAITNESICLLNAMNILLQMKNVDCDKLSDEQNENINSVYNTISSNYLFAEQNDENYYDYILNNY